MLTFFTIPKAFRGHIEIIQRNAIQSWLLLKPKCEVILVGNDPGTSEAAREFGLLHISAVTQNSLGTPLVSSAFAETQRVAAHSMLCYLNTDIILMSDFLPAVRSASAERTTALLVGRRWDSDICELLDFSTAWEERLRRLLSENGKLHGHTGVDYFVFPKGLLREIPPFAIGRGSWDNWLIYKAKSQGAAVIDLTPMARPVHQNHDYAHLAGGRADAFGGQEAAQNLALAGGYSHLYTIADASHQLTGKGIRRNLTPYYFYRWLVTLSARHKSARWVLRGIRSLLRAIRREDDSYVFE